jgi:hypothetical protein
MSNICPSRQRGGPRALPARRRFLRKAATACGALAA